MMKISKDRVLCVSNAKYLKTDEKQAKFADLAVSVPQVSKIGKTSPWNWKMWNFIIQGPWIVLSCQKWSLNEILGNWQNRSLNFG